MHKHQSHNISCIIKLFNMIKKTVASVPEKATVWLTEDSIVIKSIIIVICIENIMLLISLRDILTSGVAAAPLPARIVRSAFLITVFSAARGGSAFLRRCGGSSCGSSCFRGGVEEKCALSRYQRALDAVRAPEPLSRRCSARWETWKSRSATERLDFRESDRLI